MKQDHRAWLKTQCNRLADGRCYTEGCLRRGGWPGRVSEYATITTAVDHSIATCVPYEIHELLEDTKGEQ